MNIFVSIGEAIDKLSILELKYKKITDENKRIEIKKEIDCLNQCEKYKNDYPFFYNLLLYINEKIWVMTDKIKTMKPDVDTLDTYIYFAELSSLIFEYNQKRFRIKNWFNNLVNSKLKEQKSYGSTYCTIRFTSEEELLNKIPEINYLLLEYDIIFIEKSNYELFIKTFKQPTVLQEREQENIEEIILNHFTIPRLNIILQELYPDENMSDIFELKL